MSETLRHKQSRFARYVGLFIRHASAQGYDLTFGQALRTDEQAEINAIGTSGREAVARLVEREFPALAAKIRNNAGSGIRNSLHEHSLAVDLNLFKDGRYLSDTESWRPLGEWWERLAPDCRWGGRFNDGNHLSIEHEGRK